MLRFLSLVAIAILSVFFMVCGYLTSLVSVEYLFFGGTFEWPVYSAMFISGTATMFLPAYLLSEKVKLKLLK